MIDGEESCTFVHGATPGFVVSKKVDWASFEEQAQHSSMVSTSAPAFRFLPAWVPVLTAFDNELWVKYPFPPQVVFGVSQQ